MTGGQQIWGKFGVNASRRLIPAVRAAVCGRGAAAGAGTPRCSQTAQSAPLRCSLPHRAATRGRERQGVVAPTPSAQPPAVPKMAPFPRASRHLSGVWQAVDAAAPARNLPVRLAPPAPRRRTRGCVLAAGAVAGAGALRRRSLRHPARSAPFAGRNAVPSQRRTRVALRRTWLTPSLRGLTPAIILQRATKSGRCSARVGVAARKV